MDGIKSSGILKELLLFEFINYQFANNPFVSIDQQI